MDFADVLFAKQFAKQNSSGNVDLSDYYTKNETDQLITSKVAEIVADAPEDFDTLKEMSDWITNHEDSAAAMNSAIAANTAAIAGKADKTTTYTKTENDNLLNGKVDKVSGKGLSTEDFTTDLKTKLNGLENYDDTEIKNDIKTNSDKIKQLEVLINNYHNTVIYGYHVDPNESDSAAAVSYIAEAVGMTPAKMGATTFDYGSWKNAFFMPKPCMLKYDGTVAYYLDPNDYTKKLDGTPSDIANPDFEGNAMMEWGQIWYKFVGGDEDGEGYFYISNRQADESYHCWCNYDANDNVTPHFYTYIYNSTLHNGKFRSLSGYALTQANGSGYTTGTQEITYCTANNTTNDIEWYTDVYSDRLLINALLVLMGKSLDTQATFGRGLDTGNEATKNAYITGSLNDKGLFWGNTSSGTSGVKVFGMENWWGCVWHRIAGCVSVAHDYKIKLTYGTADGTTATGYNSIGNGYISTGNNPSTNGYIKKLKYSEYGYIPFEVSGSSTTYYGDYYYQNTATNYLLVGGRSGYGVDSGAFYFSLYNALSYSNWSVSAALSCKPLA